MISSLKCLYSKIQNISRHCFFETETISSIMAAKDGEFQNKSEWLHALIYVFIFNQCYWFVDHWIDVSVDTKSELQSVFVAEFWWYKNEKILCTVHVWFNIMKLCIQKGTLTCKHEAPVVIFLHHFQNRRNASVQFPKMSTVLIITRFIRHSLYSIVLFASHFAWFTLDL